MQPLFTIHAGEYLTGSHIEQHLRADSKRIIIETLISSNVRISHYKDYNEHHITRWLGLNNDNEPGVSLREDDCQIHQNHGAEN